MLFLSVKFISCAANSLHLFVSNKSTLNYRLRVSEYELKYAVYNVLKYSNYASLVSYINKAVFVSALCSYLINRNTV